MRAMSSSRDSSRIVVETPPVDRRLRRTIRRPSRARYAARADSGPGARIIRPNVRSSSVAPDVPHQAQVALRVGAKGGQRFGAHDAGQVGDMIADEIGEIFVPFDAH